MKKVIFILLLFVSTCFAESKDYGDIDCKFLRNYDGDTITVNIKYWHPLFGDEISIRINGIDTPELRGTEGEIHAKARAAKKLVNSACKNAKFILLKNMKRGKYFRIVADVYVDNENLADILLKNGLAVKYDGGKK